MFLLVSVRLSGSFYCIRQQKTFPLGMPASFKSFTILNSALAVCRYCVLFSREAISFLFACCVMLPRPSAQTLCSTFFLRCCLMLSVSHVPHRSVIPAQVRSEEFPKQACGNHWYHSLQVYSFDDLACCQKLFTARSAITKKATDSRLLCLRWLARWLLCSSML